MFSLDLLLLFLNNILLIFIFILFFIFAEDGTLYYLFIYFLNPPRVYMHSQT